MKKLLRRDEAAAHLALDPRTVYDRVRDGDLPALRVGRLLRFGPVALDAWLKQSNTKPIEPEPEPITAPAVDATAWTDLPINARLLRRRYHGRSEESGVDGTSTART
jgi:excisionase family DNA binding protein